MKKLTLVFILVSLQISTNSFANDNPFKPVQELFSAMSAVDHIKMKSLVTSDFQLLEVGEDWDIDDLIKVINPSDYKRKNYFNVIRKEIDGNMAWVSYWNKATFTNGYKLEQVAWLESAIMVKASTGWKIQMLHSTKIDADKIPKNIALEEYTK